MWSPKIQNDNVASNNNNNPNSGNHANRATTRDCPYGLNKTNWDMDKIKIVGMRVKQSGYG